MKRSWKHFLAGALIFGISASQAAACGPSNCRTSCGAARGVPVANGPQDEFDPQNGPTSTPDGLANNDEVINDLPADAKRAIRAAASKARKGPTVQNVSQRSQAAPTPAARTSHDPDFNERMNQMVAAQRNLAAQTARLESKLDELKRWDDAAQEKFRRAFGTTDEATRQQIAKLLAGQIARNQQAASAMANGANMDFYMQTKRQ